VPPKVKREHRENTAQFAQAIRNATHEDATCAKWNRELERLDPLLRLVKGPDWLVIGTPLVPGAYHLLRANPGAPMSVTPIVDSEGRALMEPPGKLLEQLQGMDLQDVRVERMRERIRRAEAEREERRKVGVREGRRAEALERWRAVSETQVSMNRDTPWSQNAAGKRGAKKAA
jgi:hypothetical protein